MSWPQMLCATYDACRSMVGQVVDDRVPLMPVAHTTQVAQIEIMIDAQGNWMPHACKVLQDKQDAITIIPCTEDSQSRTSSFVPHPLFDKLQYIAGDYLQYGGDEKRAKYTEYMAQLHGWCASEYSCPQVCAVEKYLEKGTLIADLVRSGCLATDENGKVLRAWDDRVLGTEGKPEIFKVIGDPMNAFVRIRVLIPDVVDDRIWLDRNVWNSFIGYYESIQEDKGLCYIEGKAMPCSDKSPSKIRSTADKAKLISSNDSQGFTYLGRFETADQAMTVGYRTSQEMHNALKWLIERQSYRSDDLVYVSWNTETGATVCPFVSFEDWYDSYLAVEDEALDTRVEYSKRLNLAMAGYSRQTDDDAGIVVLGLDAATKGRLSAIYYRELRGSELKRNIENWYSTCAWRMPVSTKRDASKKSSAASIDAVGTPSLKEIAYAAYGENADKKLVSATVRRLVPCIIDTARIPRDLVSRTALRACNPVAMEQWEFRKVLSIACALIRKEHIDYLKEEWDMDITSDVPVEEARSYIFGRILAYYDYFERTALYLADEKVNDTNALRFMNQYRRKPASITNRLEERTYPYCRRLRSNIKTAARYQRFEQELNGLIGSLKGGDGHALEFDDKPLDNTFLLGYSSQMSAFYTKKTNQAESEE